MPSRILWIDGQDSGAEPSVSAWPSLSLPNVDITPAADLEQALCYLDTESFDAVVVRLCRGEAGIHFLESLCLAVQSGVVLVLAPEATIADAVLWTKLGASQVLQNEIDLSSAVLGLTGRAKRDAAAGPEWRRMLIGNTSKMNEIAEVIRLIAPRRCTALITGETGTGKEVVARSIHAASNRAHLEMVSVNCSALPEHLLEAELFGHVKGAFTGAAGNRIGRFEQAHRSTLFLDEVGDLPLPLQAKLLRALQEREFQRLGSSETIRVDVRIIAATNVNLLDKIRAGSFREDLYYRLNVVPIQVPALRERAADIPVLAHHFIEKVCEHEGLERKHVSEEVLQRLRQYDWPGNVRQLENMVEMAVALSGERRLLCPSDFPLPARVTRPVRQNAFVAVPDQGLDFEQTVGTFELNILEQALRKTGGNKKLAAEMLGLKRTTLAAKLKSLTETMPGALISQ
ncbi:MAG: sigma-54-dependent Fis family transcriptional regulator [Acidobacteriaceae bacterium]|nr:sigma-54-dependent Fis family transcriptional regulator [Acidobacteriaceae bacterium]